MPHSDGSLEGCQHYVQKIIVGLKARFPDLGPFNATKLFSPCHDAFDDVAMDSSAKRGLIF